MRFLYEETAAGIRILRSFGGDPSVVLPEMVEGKPATELGPYAFSDHIDQKDLEKAIETGRFCREDGEAADGTDENLSVSGEKVSEVFLPETLKKIGRYAFYNCRKLKKIALGGTCMDVGAGAFTGCHQVEEIRITVQSDGTSALREILTELPETIRVDWKKEGLKGVFWFPEFFEEGVENTPARILENHIHGSGLRYRNCFARNSLNIREYDELFPYAKAWDEEGVVLEMALGRLLFPVELGEKAEEHYLSHIREQDYVIALAIDGKMLDSVELSDLIARLGVQGKSSIVFVIGGSLGLSDAVLKRADYKLSFSRMTFPHQLMQMILLEQIYRGYRIMNHEPYHK